jgi:hypothetical protein
MGMTTEDNNQNSGNQKKKPVDIMYRSNGYVGETTTKYNDGTVETNLERIERMKNASKGDPLVYKLDSVQQSRQAQSSPPPSELPKDKPTRQNKNESA